MSDARYAWMCFWIGALFSLVVSIVTIKDAKFGYEGINLIGACEADLPRNERCVLIAIPETKEVNYE